MAVTTEDILQRLQASLRQRVETPPQAVNVGTVATVGDIVGSTGRIIEVPVGDELLGRVVDPLGRPLDGKGPIATTKNRPIERIAPGVITRQGVTVPVQTGIMA